MSTATLQPEPVDTGDRLSFTFFLAVAIHALLILGVTFKAELGRKPPPPTLEITLASHQSATTPEEAEYLAQFNQEASGTSEENKPQTTDQLAPINDALIRENNPTPQQKRITATPPEQLAPITTSGESQFKAALVQTAEEQQQPKEGADEQDTPLSAEIASLRAQLDRQRRAIAKKPRLRRITSVATRSSVDAAYLNRWTSKVELVGNRNFPEEAIQRQIYGKLRLATTVRTDGSVQSVELLQSSGHPVLDEAALQIVKLASPFPEFPLELRKDVDLLEIIRTWHFELSGLSTSSASN